MEDSMKNNEQHNNCPKKDEKNIWMTATIILLTLLLVFFIFIIWLLIKFRKEKAKFKRDNEDLRLSLSAENYVSNKELIKMNKYSDYTVTISHEEHHEELTVTDDGKQVKLIKINPGPEATKWPCALGSKQLARNYTWNVEVGEKGSWALGVTRNEETVKEKKYTPNSKGLDWVLSLSKGKTLEASSGEIMDASQRPRKIRVYLDFKKSMLYFTDIETRSHLHKCNVDTTKPLYPVFSPGSSDKGPLIIIPND
ncbi:butyrophilin subfamily 1 member A1-like [Erpetoichthys calabaricus]|uniref:Butyrophilin subfamily 1 member A1-like n=1 Tax=Erpetoichthys calabaricus TaxID=27687 RepID=A0A8C4RDA6_ERPCA|nr:butyrophilin subfamily 1 member A1-like [Erpetoichthys calabaricus]XP_028649500.1 butyrophilin subfamily 1 member A1-like [Erpetoichthys calabaricus]